MIKMDNFFDFLFSFFKEGILFEKVRSDYWWTHIDCFPAQDYLLALEISVEQIQITSISSGPGIDFSLYDYQFSNNGDAENFIKEVVKKKKYPFIFY